MFDRLIQLLLEFWDDFKPWVVVMEYEEGVIFRRGRVLKRVTPGLWWKIPLLDTRIKDTVVTQTLTIPAQSLMTKDGKHITVKSVVKYNITDIILFLTKVYDRVDALSDTTQTIVKQFVSQNDWLDINTIDNEITKKLRVQAKKWGIEIEEVNLTDATPTFALRLFNENIKE